MEDEDDTSTTVLLRITDGRPDNKEQEAAGREGNGPTATNPSRRGHQSAGESATMSKREIKQQAAEDRPCGSGGVSGWLPPVSRSTAQRLGGGMAPNRKIRRRPFIIKEMAFLFFRPGGASVGLSRRGDRRGGTSLKKPKDEVDKAATALAPASVITEG